MRHVLAFLATMAHEGGWLLYIRGVAEKRLVLALVGNAWILATGMLTVHLVATDLAVLPATVVGGTVATALFWRFNRR